MPNTYALLDVDQTLINSDATILNDGLLDALKKKGITDICLFTNMYANQIALDIGKPKPYAREGLIEELQKRGFTVHKVITPMDVLIGRPGAYYEEHWKPAYEKAKANGKTDPTVATMDDALENKLGNRSKNKGDMYQVVVNHLTDIPKKGSKTPDSFIFFDDKEEEIKHVKEANSKMESKLPLTAVTIQTKAGIYDPKILAKIKNDVPNWGQLAKPEKDMIAKKYTIPGDIPTSPDEEKNYSKRKPGLEKKYTAQIASHFNMLRHKPALHKKTAVHNLRSRYDASSSEERTPSFSRSETATTSSEESVKKTPPPIAASPETKKAPEHQPRPGMGKADQIKKLHEAKGHAAKVIHEKKSHQTDTTTPNLSDLKKLARKFDAENKKTLLNERDKVNKQFEAAVKSGSIQPKDKEKITEWKKAFDKNIDKFLSKHHRTTTVANKIDQIRRFSDSLDKKIHEMPRRQLPPQPTQKKMDATVNPAGISSPPQGASPPPPPMPQGWKKPQASPTDDNAATKQNPITSSMSNIAKKLSPPGRPPTDFLAGIGNVKLKNTGVSPGSPPPSPTIHEPSELERRIAAAQKNDMSDSLTNPDISDEEWNAEVPDSTSSPSAINASDDLMKDRGSAPVPVIAKDAPAQGTNLGENDINKILKRREAIEGNDNPDDDWDNQKDKPPGP